MRGDPLGDAGHRGRIVGIVGIVGIVASEQAFPPAAGGTDFTKPSAAHRRA